jgi:hypothetical protein
MGINDQRIILSCFMEIKTAAKTKYVEYVSFYKTFKVSFISFNSGVRYVLFFHHLLALKHKRCIYYLK